LNIKKILTVLLALIALSFIPTLNVQADVTDTNITSSIGWKNENGSWYYYKSDNTKAIGWIKPDNNWYHLDEDSGKMTTGWLEDKGNWYYMDDNGAMVKGWKQLDGDWYLLTDSGARATGIQQDNSNLYYFKDSGVMATNTGWTKINDKWYYFDKDGKIHTGWVENNDKWYYSNDDGSMVTGTDKIGNTTYVFSDTGEMETGWVNVNNNWYYFNTDRSVATGWINLDGVWYYLNDNGSMATGWVTSNGSDYYYLDPTSGKMLTDTTIDGYKIGSDGKRYKPLNTIPLSTSSKGSGDTMKKIYNSVNDSANKYELDSKLILAIIKAESDFDPNATSSSGATGLMQIMPQNYTYLGMTDGYDIEQNIDGGSKLLKEYLNQFNGDVKIAIAAYNAGPQNVKKDGVLSDDDLCKMSQGVQDYVKRVMQYYKDGSIAIDGKNLIEA